MGNGSEGKDRERGWMGRKVSKGMAKKEREEDGSPEKLPKTPLVWGPKTENFTKILAYKRLQASR